MKNITLLKLLEKRPDVVARIDGDPILRGMAVDALLAIAFADKEAIKRFQSQHPIDDSEQCTIPRTSLKIIRDSAHSSLYLGDDKNWVNVDDPSFY